MAQHYEIEVWSKENQPLGDISQFVTNFSWSKTLNDSGACNISIDMARYNDYIESLGFGGRPFEFLDIGRSDIRIKRNGVYVWGGNVAQMGYTANANSVTIAIQCTDYFGYYKFRYYTGTFTNTAQTTILANIITQLNAETGGDYGIRWQHAYGTVTRRDRTYERKEVKALFTDMANVINGIDFEVTPDKKLYLWNTVNKSKGVYRPNIELSYPFNIKGFNFYRTASNVSNHVVAVGKVADQDTPQPVATAEDVESENYMYRRDRVVSYSSVTSQSVLQNHADSVLFYTKDVVAIPQITVGDDVLDLSVVDVGDTIRVSLTGDPALVAASGNYRIKSFTCHVDENMAEEVNLTFDDLDINKIIQHQQEEQ